MKNITQMIRNMKEKMDQTKEELKNTKVEVSSPEKEVRAVFNGNQELEEFTLDARIIHSDMKEKLERLIMQTVNLGIEKSSKAAKKHMSHLTGGFKLPMSLKDLF